MKNNIFLEGYFEYLQEVRKLKKDSVKDVRCTFNRLAEHLELNGLKAFAWELEQDDFINFFMSQRRNGKSAGSISKFITHLRTFLNYCWKVGKVSRNVLDGYSIVDSNKRVAPSVLSLEQIQQLISSLPQRTAIEREKRLIILTLYGLGLRTGELCRLNLRDIDLDKREVYIFKSKNDINRYVPIPDGLFVELAIHLKGQRRKSGPLFQTTHKKKRVGIPYVGSIVKEAAVRVGFDKITPKTFRHTFASHLIQKQVPLEVLASLLGHKTPKETGVYLHSFEVQRMNSVNELEHMLAKEEE